MDSTNSQGTDSSKQPNIKSPQSIFHRIWYPTQDDILKLGMFFTASLIAGIMILSPILRLLGNNQTLTYILLSFFLLLVVLLVTMAIRIQITRSSNIDSTSNNFFSKLPDKHRKKFFMGAFVYMPIGCLLGIIPITVLINYVSKFMGRALSVEAIIFICLLFLLCFLVVVYSLWNFYNTLCTDKEL